jgi:hypothetical protein
VLQNTSLADFFEPPTLDGEPEGGRSRAVKEAHKSRGSLLDKLNTTTTFTKFSKNKGVQRMAVARTPQVQQEPFAQPRIKKVPALLEKQVSPDVYIPSVVSVGALAQLLNVKLGPLF